jgi:hypothetical protein
VKAGKRGKVKGVNIFSLSPLPLTPLSFLGELLELVSLDDNNITLANITQRYVREQDNPELFHHAAHSQAYQV